MIRLLLDEILVACNGNCNLCELLDNRVWQSSFPHAFTSYIEVESSVTIHDTHTYGNVASSVRHVRF